MPCGVRRSEQYLGSIKFGGRIGIGVVGRDVDIPVDIVLGRGLDNPLGTLDMHVFEREVPAQCPSACE